MVNSWKKTCGIASDLYQKWPINFLILLIPVQRLTKYKLRLNRRTSLNQKGLKRQQSTALNWFQPDHGCSTCIDETQSVRKLPLPHYHAKISTHRVDPHLARHNICKRAQRTTHALVISGNFHPFLKLMTYSPVTPWNFLACLPQEEGMVRAWSFPFLTL